MKLFMNFSYIFTMVFKPASQPAGRFFPKAGVKVAFNCADLQCKMSI